MVKELELYLASFTGRHEGTLRNKRARLLHLFDFGFREDWNEQTVKEFYEHLKDKGLAVATIKEVLREVKAFLRWLRKRHYAVFIDESAFRNLWQAYSLKARKRKEVFTEEELEKFFAYCDTKPPIYKVFFLLLLHSGLRVNEALSLTSENLVIKKLKDKEVLFIRVKKGKFGKEREVPMPLLSEEEKNFFKRFFANRKDKKLWQYILRYPKSVKEKTLNLWSVEKFCQLAEKELGFPVYPHKFRYTYISSLLSQGFSPHAVAQWAGHEKVKTTLEVYAVVLTEKELEKFAL